jgi:hypothetical protein
MVLLLVLFAASALSEYYVARTAVHITFGRSYAAFLSTVDFETGNLTDVYTLERNILDLGGEQYLFSVSGTDEFLLFTDSNVYRVTKGILGWGKRRISTTRYDQGFYSGSGSKYFVSFRGDVFTLDGKSGVAAPFATGVGGAVTVDASQQLVYAVSQVQDSRYPDTPMVVRAFSFSGELLHKAVVPPPTNTSFYYNTIYCVSTFLHQQSTDPIAFVGMFQNDSNRTGVTRAGTIDPVSGAISFFQQSAMWVSALVVDPQNATVLLGSNSGLSTAANYVVRLDRATLSPLPPGPVQAVFPPKPDDAGFISLGFAAR